MGTDDADGDDRRRGLIAPFTLLVGRRADRWGRKPLLIIGFLALPLRAILYCLWHNPLWLIGVQLLDGVGAGLLSAAKPLVVSDLMDGTGRYNLALGVVGTLQGVGASLSFVIAGALVQRFDEERFASLLRTVPETDDHSYARNASGLLTLANLGSAYGRARGRDG